LRVIDISDSNLGSDNALRIFEQLLKCENLKEIYANYNDIEDKETQNEISELIIKHPKVIEKLVLRGNEIRKAVFKKIVKSKKVIDTDCYSENEMEQDELNELMDELKLC